MCVCVFVREGGRAEDGGWWVGRGVLQAMVVAANPWTADGVSEAGQEIQITVLYLQRQ